MDLKKKFRIDIDRPLWVINAPDDCMELFAKCDVKEKLPAKKQVGQVLLFAQDSKELAHYLSVLGGHIGHETLFWIFYPKKSGRRQSDLVLVKSWELVFQLGYRGQSSASLTDDWTGLRVTNAPKKEPTICDLPMEERKLEGIDFVQRTVQLPKDAIAALGKHKGMLDFFNAMSFTHKKEYVMAIVDAKKEETRKRRIEKMAAMLQQKMRAKAPSP